MSTILHRSILVAAMLAIPLALPGCGGGGDTPFNPDAALFTTAPAQVTLDAGATVSYRLNGGTPLYSASSGNPNVVRATTDGLSVNLTGLTPGSAMVSIADSAGSKLSFNVTVVTPGFNGPLAVTPASLSVGNCTTRVPFIFNGGTAPFRVLTTNNFSAPVSSPIALGDGRHYFLADFAYGPVQTPGGIAVVVPSTLTVLDSQGHSATSDVSTSITDSPCPTNPLFLVSPESADFRTSEILAFQLSGGSTTPTVPTVTFADSGVAQVISVSATNVVVQAVSAVRATTLMTVANADGQRASVVIRVLPQP
ncbi:MAG: hypothetical protein Q8R01_05870 [Ramlibacter sp.]|nr:hypothetical protein [Ramlibacter sp.]